MRHQQNINRQAASLALMLALAALGSGCASVKASKTVGLPGLTPIADARQVKVVERRKDVALPYQVVGQVTVHRSGTMLTTGTSLKRMKQIAAEMGADGLIGLTESHADGKLLGIGSGFAWVHSCLAVKWLAPGQSPQPLSVPVVIGLLPSATESDPSRLSQMLQESVSATLGLKGYYLLPLKEPVLKGGLDELKSFGDRELMAVGGPETQLLMEVAVADSKFNYAVVGNTVKAQFQVSILNKETRSYLLQERRQQSEFESAVGSGIIPWTMDKHRRDVFTRIVNSALSNLKPVCEEANSK